MPLAYYSMAATMAFWSEHWAEHSVEELLQVARTSPLTEIIERHLPSSGGLLLEADCGLGQYVLLLGERGHAAMGVDWGFDAVRQGVQAGASLAVMDLRALGIRDCSVSTYLSLGVVEHNPEGPGGIVAEVAGVLTTDGVLLLSVPYWNGVRRLFAPYPGRFVLDSPPRLPLSFCLLPYLSFISPIMGSVVGVAVTDPTDEALYVGYDPRLHPERADDHGAGGPEPTHLRRRVPLGQLVAPSVITTIPVVALYMFIHRWMVEGLAAGAIKG